MNDIIPSAEQTKVKTDFCAVCPDGKSPADPKSCSGFFSATLLDGGVPGAGSLTILPLNDSIAQQVDAKCIGATDGGPGSDCYDTFLICSLGILEEAVPEPAACTGDGG
jgi:hypothetical protein